MKVGTFTSVGAKLFYYMTGLVLLTVIGNSIQFRKTFMLSQTKQVQDSVQTQAERTAGQIESSLDSWRSQIAVALPTLQGDVNNSPIDVLQRFVDSSPDFLALQLLSAPSKNSTTFNIFAQAFTNRLTDPRFEEKSSEKVKMKLAPSAITWLQSIVGKNQKTNMLLENASPAVGLPIAWIAVRFDVSGDKTVVWALLTVWQSQLVKALAKSQFIHTTIVNKDGRVFSSPTLPELLGKSDVSKNPLTSQAFAANSPSGFVNEFRDASGKRLIGAYSRLPKYGLTVLVEQDVEFAYQVLNRNLLNTALWASLFILISIMFSYIGATGITKGLRSVAEATYRIASGDFKTRISLTSRDEVGLLGHAVNNMSSQIVDLLESQVKKAQFEKELETAKVVQSTFFPKTDPSKEALKISSFYTPASECGGDLWGHFTISDGLEFIFVADAMGHGAPAALVTAMAYSSTMTIAEFIRTDPKLAKSPAEILSRINKIIWEAVRGSISLTFFASVLDLKKGTLTYANAGHNFPVLLPKDPSDPRLQNVKNTSKHNKYVPISLKLMGTPLGIDETAKFKDQIIELKAGDKLFYFTDGLIECESIDGSALGRKWLLDNISALGDCDADQLKQGIINKAFEFFADQPIKDDITVVVMEISADWKPIETSNTDPRIHLVPPTPTISNIASLNEDHDLSSDLKGNKTLNYQAEPSKPGGTAQTMLQSPLDIEAISLEINATDSMDHQRSPLSRVEKSGARVKLKSRSSA